jgi:hypothetical protein
MNQPPYRSSLVLGFKVPKPRELVGRRVQQLTYMRWFTYSLPKVNEEDYISSENLGYKWGARRLRPLLGNSALHSTPQTVRRSDLEN